MSNPNLGWLYYKDYLRINGDPVRLFQERKLWEREEQEKQNNAKKENFEKFFNGFIDDDKVYHPGKNQIILSQQFNAATSIKLAVADSNPLHKFKTTYPGLTMGTGYTHETGEMGEFKLGFFFDHATGYPCIPGSTVKGCLRGMFPQEEHEKIADKKEKYDYLASVICELPDLREGFVDEYDLGKEFDQKVSQKREQFIDLLEREIFDGEKPERHEDGSPKKKDLKIVYQQLCVYERDIFFDGYILATDHPGINRSTYQNPKPFIADDYITPHINRKKPELSPFTNPVPLMFLKVLPEVILQFQFDLKEGLLSKLQKEELFCRLLLDFGIGAKTNVGYGQFTENYKGTDLKIKIKGSSDGPGTNPEVLNRPYNSFPREAIPYLIKNNHFSGVVSEIIGDYYIFTFDVKGYLCRFKKRKNDKLILAKGDEVDVICNNDYTTENLNISIKPKKK